MQEVFGHEYLLNGYITYGDPIPIQWNNEKCELQKYQGEHKYEYVITNSSGERSLFYNGVLKRTWTEVNGLHQGDFYEYECGKMKFIGDINKMMEDECVKMRFNTPNGLLLTILDKRTNSIIYRGQYNKSLNRHGRGIQYSKNGGNEELEGVWNNDRLSRVLKRFNQGVMTEFADEGDPMDCSSRVPIYIGGYCFDERLWTFVRDGKGYLIDKETRTAYREGEWKNGEEVSGVDLIDGWYQSDAITCCFSDTNKEDSTVAAVGNLVIEPNSLNSLSTVDWSSFITLKSINIGDNSLVNVNKFELSYFHLLQNITIGNNCFYPLGKPPESGEVTKYDFQVRDCRHLKSISIGAFSFANWGGKFDLKGLPELETLQIGDMENESWNFCGSSLTIQDLPNLKTVKLGYASFVWSVTTTFRNLASLERIELGKWTLQGSDSQNCSLTMENLPALASIVSNGDRNFYYQSRVTIRDILNVKEVKLPKSFKNVKNPFITSFCLDVRLHIDVSDELSRKIGFRVFL